MKKHFRTILLLLTVVMVLSFSGTTFAASLQQKAIKAYKKVLSSKTIVVKLPRKKKKFSTSKLYAALVYVDNNSVPELLINSDPSSTHGLTAILGYKKGKVTALYARLSDFVFSKYYRKMGVLISESRNDGKDFYAYQFINRALIEIAQHSRIQKYTDNNGIMISRSKYLSILNGYTQDTDATMITYWANTRANRSKYLRS